MSDEDEEVTTEALADVSRETLGVEVEERVIERGKEVRQADMDGPSWDRAVARSIMAPMLEPCENCDAVDPFVGADAGCELCTEAVERMGRALDLAD
jgi:hypothetical protein